MKVNRTVLKLNAKPHTISGILSFSIGIVALICVIVSIYISAFSQGTRKDFILVGVLEWIAAMLTIAGITFGVYGEMSVEREKIFAHIGLGFHAIGFVYHIIVIANGF